MAEVTRPQMMFAVSVRETNNSALSLQLWTFLVNP